MASRWYNLATKLQGIESKDQQEETMGYSVFVGDVAKDEYYRLERLPRLGEKIAAEALPAQLGGMIANAACVYRSYGEKTRFLSCLHPDDDALCEQLEGLGIDTSLVQYDDQLGPSKCIICLAEEEHTVIIPDMKRRPVILPHNVREVLCGAEYIYSNYWELKWLGNTPEETLQILQEWHENGVKLICDVDVDDLNHPLYQNFLAYTHILFMNKVGFQNLCGGRAPKEAVGKLLSTGLYALIVTLAEDGCILYTSGGEAHIPAEKVHVVDVTGAGDTFCSTFLWCYKRTKDLQLAGRFASYAAARAVTSVGARSGACGIEPVLDFIAQRGGDADYYRIQLT